MTNTKLITEMFKANIQTVEGYWKDIHPIHVSHNNLCHDIFLKKRGGNLFGTSIPAAILVIIYIGYKADVNVKNNNPSRVTK